MSTDKDSDGWRQKLEGFTYNDDTGTFDDETKIMSWRERRAFRKTERRVRRANARLLKAAAKEARRMRRAHAKAERTSTRNPGFRDAAVVVLSTMDGINRERPRYAAAVGVLNRIGRMRDRRFKYVATIGTWLVVLIVALLATCSCAGRSTGSTYPKTGATRDSLAQFDAVVSIEKWCAMFDEKSGRLFSAAQGTGVVLDATHVLTAAHVVSCYDGDKRVPEATAIMRLGHKGLSYYGHIVKIDVVRDVALIVLNADVFTTEPVQVGTVKIGDEVCEATAFPDRQYKCGTVARFHDVHHIVTDIQVRPGNSGSGLYARGKLVGIVRAVTWCSFVDEQLYAMGEPFAEFAKSCAGYAASIPSEVLP
jgi:Trypsin-like peptidase domain